jgi:hypothetical protein
MEDYYFNVSVRRLVCGPVTINDNKKSEKERIDTHLQTEKRMESIRLNKNCVTMDDELVLLLTNNKNTTDISAATVT